MPLACEETSLDRFITADVIDDIDEANVSTVLAFLENNSESFCSF